MFSGHHELWPKLNQTATGTSAPLTSNCYGLSGEMKHLRRGEQPGIKHSIYRGILLTYLPTYLPAYQPDYLPTYLTTYLCLSAWERNQMFGALRIIQCFCWGFACLLACFFVISLYDEWFPLCFGYRLVCAKLH